MPAHASIQDLDLIAAKRGLARAELWIPAFAGMTLC